MEKLYNINIERSVLSTILYNPKIYEEIANTLDAEDFYYPAHQNILKAMARLYNNDQPIDEDFVRKELEGEGKFDQEALLEILATNPIANTFAYLGEIKEFAIRRQLIALTTDIRRQAGEEMTPIDDALNAIQQKLTRIMMNQTDKDFKESSEVVMSTLEKIKEMKERGNTMLSGMDTGYTELNRKTTGFNKGDLIIIAARPAMGKTAFVLNIAASALRHGKGVAFFSLEMPAEQLMLRMLSSDAGISMQDLRLGNLTDGDYEKLSVSTDKFMTAPLFVDDYGALNINTLRAKLRKLKSRHKELGVAIIDYLQLMNGTGSKDRHQEVSDISRGLKLLARELEIPIIALSQLNRGLEMRADKRPMLADLRESGSIEQDADMIFFVYRDDVYRIRDEKEKEKKAHAEGKEYKSTFVEKEEEEAEIIIGKNRNGPTGIVDLLFQKRFTRFVSKEHRGFEVEYITAPTKIDIGSLPTPKMDVSGLPKF